MNAADSKSIRNLVLTGHAGGGKTTLVESMLYVAGATGRLGSVRDGNTVCDGDPESIRRRASVLCSVAPLGWKGVRINLLDTPGLFDFEGEALMGLAAADCVLIVVSGRSGVSVGTEKAWKWAVDSHKPRAFYISKIGAERADYFRVLGELRERFGPSVCPASAPYGRADGTEFVTLSDGVVHRFDEKGAGLETVPAPSGDRLDILRDELREAVAGTDEKRMERYFAGGPFAPEEIARGLHDGLLDGSIAPVFCGAYAGPAGASLLLDAVAASFPSAWECPREARGEDGPVQLRADPSAPAAALVFKTVADPYVGKLSFFRVMSGTVHADAPLFDPRAGRAERVGKLYSVRGRKQTEVRLLSAGDIGAAAKMAVPLTGDTLCDPKKPVELPGIEFPEPCYSMAVKPKSRGDEDRISPSLRRLEEEDPTLRFRVDPETRQQIVSGLGEQHLDAVVSKLRGKFGVNVGLSEPRVAYRETIRKKVKAEGRHKKQTGGHGQYGDVWIEFEPCESRELVFEERVFGGAVPRNFFPAVEKGLRECAAHGVLAGYPVVNLKATLVDGSYHPVDSSEMSFKIAAALAFKAGLPKASPVLLEPVGRLAASVPKGSMGELIGELNKRRGRVLGMAEDEDGLGRVDADVPIAEMHDFATALRSITQGRGRFTLRFDRYEEAPPQVTRAVIASTGEAAAG